MLDFVNKSLTAIFGSKSKRDVKALLPVVELVNAEYAKLKGISDNALRGETTKLKAEISKGLEVVDGKIAALHKAIQEDTSLDVQKKEDMYDQIDKLEEERNKELEVILNDILPRAFAVVKETARRWKENGQMEVDATDHDRAIAAKKRNVELKGSSAIWHNKWDAAGVEVVWDMLHYDVQLMGGMVLHSGKIAEMSTGEGKTLVATLPAYLNALAGRGVHIVTVNDYLARRDSEWMAPVFEFHGLTVDCIDYHEPHSEERQQAYLADITYGTNNEFGFDYLRDNMSHSPKDLVQRRHHFAMVDEVDSVLIDDARTPLIISGPVPRGDEHEYQELKPRIHQLVEEQKKLAQNFLNEARKKISEGDEKEGGLALFRAHRGLPTYKPLIKYLSEQGNRAILLKTENFFLQDNQSQMHIADEPLLFVIDEKHNHIDLTDRGIETITQSGEDTALFVLPDIATELSAIERATGLNDVDKLEKKEQLLSDYKIKQERIHTLTQLLKAYTLFEKDVDYIIVDSKVKIVDEQTGRVMEGRRYSDGLHQALEAKENVRIEEATQTYATVTLQNYFRMYHKLCGMTGTAETEATEFWEIYKLDVVVIPTNKQAVRKDMEDKVYKTTREKFNAVADEILELTKAGRPVLVGTTSVEISELLSRMLKIRNIKHQVLNAKQHQKEAEIVAEAGKPGTVTIATNMAGRGTDIKLTPESRAAGGLAIVGTERHESRRVDRQLRGRSGRQGDPGTTQFFVSLEDNLMRLFGSDRIAKVMDMMKLPEGEVIQHSMITKSIERAQKKVEENNFGMRKRLLEYDDVMNYQRKAIYKRRRNALFGDRLEVDVLNMIFDTAEDIAGMKGVSSYNDFKLAVIDVFGLNTNITEEEYQKEKAEALTHKLYLQVIGEYTARYTAITEKVSPIFRDVLAQRGDQVATVNMPFTDGTKMIHVSADPRKVLEPGSTELRLAVEKYASLGFIDTSWREHLREMDDLRQYVQNAVYEQKDPLMLYKFEGFELFKKLVSRINKETVSFLYDADLPKQGKAEVQLPAPKQVKQPAYREAKEEVRSVLSGGAAGQSAGQAQGAPVAEAEKVQPIRSQKVANRNDKVSVQYMDGTIKRDVKYKVVEDDVLSNRCVIIED